MVPFVGPGGKVFPLTTVTSLPFPPRANLLILSGLSGFVSRLEWHSGISRASCFELRWHHDHRASTELVFPNKQSHQVMLVEEGICLSWSSAPSLFRSRVPGICFRLPCLSSVPIRQYIVAKARTAGRVRSRLRLPLVILTSGMRTESLSKTNSNS